MTDLTGMTSLIEEAIQKRSAKAASSPYDRKVGIAAISASRARFRDVPLKGTEREYLSAVIDAISQLQDSYEDPDGEHSSGRGDIGSLIYDLSKLPVGP